MKFFNKRNREQEPGQQGTKRQGLTRREFVIGGIATEIAAELAAATDAPDAGIEIGYRYIMNLKVNIPQRLRRQKVVYNSTLIGLGDSLADAYGGDGKPMVELIEGYAARRGIPLQSENKAIPGSLTSAIVGQALNAQEKIPFDATQSPVIWTGHNDFGEDTHLQKAIARAQNEPFNIVRLFRLWQVINSAVDRFETSYEKSVREVLRITKAQSMTVILPAPEEYAPRVVQVDRRSGRITQVVPIRGNHLLEAGMALLRYIAGKRIVQVVEKLADEGVDIGVYDPAQSITQKNYTRFDEHPNNLAYQNTAKGVAEMFEGEKFAV